MQNALRLAVSFIVMVGLIMVIPMYSGWLFYDPTTSFGAGTTAGLFLFMVEPVTRGFYRKWRQRPWIGRDNPGAWSMIGCCALVTFLMLMIVPHHWAYYAWYQRHHIPDGVYFGGLLFTMALLTAVGMARRIEPAR